MLSTHTLQKRKLLITFGAVHNILLILSLQQQKLKIKIQNRLKDRMAKRMPDLGKTNISNTVVSYASCSISNVERSVEVPNTRHQID